jgi:L-alanine-DL-glutamate epimerase-like enolase superfamily enzyme
MGARAAGRIGLTACRPFRFDRRMEPTSRRAFAKTAVAAMLGAPLRGASAAEGRRSEADLARVADTPVLRLDGLTRPVPIAGAELLRNGRAWLVRVRSADGVEAVAVPNQGKMEVAAPVFLKNVAPVFLGRDARELETLLWEVYRAQSNYKMQGLVFWVAVAAMEMALLELLAQAAQKPIAELFGGAVRRDIPVYFASSNRGNTPEAEIAHLQKLVAGSGVRALKFRLGGRMSRNADAPPGRTEKLIPLARETFGESMTLYGDANSSYDAANGIRIGRLMEEHRYGFLEEPCEFDDLWATKEVADALTIPVAGGEQEYSLHRWRWTIANRGVDIVQPDLHYGGGFIRATKVARMAAAAGMTVVPHMSGGGLGHVDVVHFASWTPNIGPFMEFKGNTDLPVVCDTSSLRCEDGKVRAPSGVGFGVKIDPDFVRRAQPVKG